MLYSDHIMGSADIREPVLLALLRNPAVERLRRVHQAGAGYLAGIAPDVTRYQHSLGAMLMIEKLGGGVREQAAAVLHDISHAAFSHTIDVLMRNRSETFHESLKNSFMRRFGVDDVLADHGMDADDFLDESAFPLLEQPQPELCADRVDYALRDLWAAGMASMDDIRAFLNCLALCDGMAVATDPVRALWFAEMYHRLNRRLYLSPLGLYCNHCLAEALGLALDSGWLRLDELIHGEDDAVMARLRQCPDPEVVDLVGRLAPSLEVVVDDENYDYECFPKYRAVDPLVWHDDALHRCSDLFPRLRDRNNRTRDAAARGIRIARRA